MTLIYALGGGCGHTQRARNIADQLGDCEILHQGPAVSDPRCTHVGTPTPAMINRRVAHATHLIVDTFPGGIAHELQLTPQAHTILIARYVDRSRYRDYDELASQYDEIWLPYPEDRCEWERPPARARFIGPITRSIQVTGKTDLLLIGDLPTSWRDLTPTATHIHGHFRSIPQAERIVVGAAGYNLSWELAQLGVPIALRPQPRRFDDQFRRAALLGTPLHHRADLRSFLEAA